jgi:hypothetical protein
VTAEGWYAATGASSGPGIADGMPAAGMPYVRIHGFGYK